MVPFDCTTTELSINLYDEWIGSEAFLGCSHIQKIHLEGRNLSIFYHTFTNLDDSSVKFPNLETITCGVGSISLCDEAIRDLPSLKSVQIGSETSISEGNFANCPTLSIITSLNPGIVYKDGLLVNAGTQMVIHFSAFFDVFRIPDKMTEIGPIAALKHSSLKKVVLHSRVVEVGYGCFLDCPNLHKIDCDDTSPILKFSGQLLVTTHGAVVWCSQSCTEAIDLEGSNAIHLGAFKNSLVPEIKIPEKLRLVNAFAFENTTNLKVLEFPGRVTCIENAFSNTNLEKIVFHHHRSFMYKSVLNEKTKVIINKKAKLSRFDCTPEHIIQTE